MRLESGQGFKEAFGGATKAKIASVKRTFSKQGLKDFGKGFKKEFFSGNDIFSAYARGKMRKKEKTEEEEVEDTGATLSKDAVTYLRIIAKNSISLHGMARDVNVLRQNIVQLVKLKGGKKTAKEKKERFGGKADEFFKTSDEKEAMLEAEKKKDTKPKPVEKEKKEEKKEEGGGFLDSIINFFKDGLLGSLASLFNPAAILKILGKVFVIATIFISLFKGITAAFDKWKETGSLKEAIISGLGAIVDFLTFGFFGEDTIRDLFNKIGDFIDPIVDSFKKVYNSVKDWIANNVGIPQLGPWKFAGFNIGPIGPYYPFKDNPSSSAEQKTVIPETPKPEGKGGESGGGGATGGWDETKKTENEKAGSSGGEGEGDGDAGAGAGAGADAGWILIIEDEPDLRELFRSFAPGEFRAAVRRGGRPGVPARATGKGWMFAWFQRLLPRTGNFFGMFEAHAATVLAGAEATARLFHGGPSAAEHVTEIAEREQAESGLIHPHRAPAPAQVAAEKQRRHHAQDEQQQGQHGGEHRPPDRQLRDGHDGFLPPPVRPAPPPAPASTAGAPNDSRMR